MIVGLLLAAGRSTRFGGDKLLAMLDGRPVLAHSAAAIAPAVGELVVVLPPGRDGLDAALAGVPFRGAINADPAGGMASSITTGIAALSPDVEAVIIALGDQPLVREDVCRRLADEWRRSSSPVVAPQYRDGRGHPVLFARECFPSLLALEGDRGAAPVIEALGERVRLVRVDHDAPADVDTPAALARLVRERSRPDS